MGSSEGDASQPSVQEYLKKIIHLIKIVQFDVKDIGMKLDNLDKIKPAPNENDYTIISHYIPINNIERINDFETLIITDREAVAQFRKLITQTGGRTAKDNIHRVLKKLFTNSCAWQCSWKGQRNNFRVSDLNFMQIMKSTFCSTFTNITEAEFETIASEWFRFARQRLVRESLKMVRKPEQQF